MVTDKDGSSITNIWSIKQHDVTSHHKSEKTLWLATDRMNLTEGGKYRKKAKKQEKKRQRKVSDFKRTNGE